MTFLKLNKEDLYFHVIFFCIFLIKITVKVQKESKLCDSLGNREMYLGTKNESLKSSQFDLPAPKQREAA